MEKHRVSCICYLSKTHFVRDFLQNSIGNSSTSTTCNPFTVRERSLSCKSQWNSVGNSSTSTTCNPIYIAGTTLQLQITMEFCRPQMHETQVKPHLQCGPIREWSAHDPPMIRPHTRPSRNRRTAEVDHRGSGTDFVWKNIGFRASAISQKQHFVRDFLQNSIGNSSTSTTCNAILTLSLTNSFPDILKVTISSVPN